MKNQALTATNFNFPGQSRFYKGKVRDVYHIGSDLLVMIATDRISAFDVVLPRGIPFKGQVLNQIASLFLDATADIVPNWKLASPDPMVTVGKACQPFAVEMVIRGYLSGSAWRNYQQGSRLICDVELPDGMKEHQRFDTPIITPTTKAAEGHDEDIAPKDIIANKLMSKEEYQMVEDYTKRLFARGTALAAKKGLILVDTKYEFGKDSEGNIRLIDEIHTPDSSRYFLAESYEDDFLHQRKQKQLSKEFVREWLMDNNFRGLEGQEPPHMTDEFVMQTSERYIELFEKVTGQQFSKADTQNIAARIEKNVENYLKDTAASRI